MSDATSGPMLIDAEHLRSVTEQNVHLVRPPHDGHQVESAVREAATLLEYHLAPVDCRDIRTQTDLLRAVCSSFDLPSGVREREEPGWHETEDLMWDIPSVFEPPHAKKGVAVFLRDPEPLMRADLPLFVLFVDTMVTGSQWKLRHGAPLHIVIGPLPDDSRYEALLSYLKVAKYFCRPCLANGVSRSIADE